MKYCSLEDIQSEFRKIDLENNTSIKPDAIEDWIVQASGDINSKIAVKYVTPITAGQDAKQLMKQVCIWLVADRVRTTLEVKDVKQETDQGVRAGSRAEALKILQEIIDGKRILVGATQTSQVDGVKSYVTANNVQRTFHKNREDW